MHLVWGLGTSQRVLQDATGTSSNRFRSSSVGVVLSCLNIHGGTTHGIKIKWIGITPSEVWRCSNWYVPTWTQMPWHPAYQFAKQLAWWHLAPWLSMSVCVTDHISTVGPKVSWEVVSLSVIFVPHTLRIFSRNVWCFHHSFRFMRWCGRSCIHVKESSELIKRTLQEQWVSWAGYPKQLSVDPAKPNISEAMADLCEANGFQLNMIAGEAHWQLGRVERHGGWFAQMPDRVVQDVGVSSQSEFKDSVVHTQCAKNSLINVHGVSPYQLVFGRNPQLPSDLLQIDPDVAASEAIVNYDGHARSNQIRQSARQSVLACQDSAALRAALRARPRPVKPFCSGDWVYCWRSQKWIGGKLIKGDQWCGAGMLPGQIGRNWVVAHRKNLIRLRAWAAASCIPWGTYCSWWPSKQWASRNSASSGTWTIPQVTVRRSCPKR